MKLVGALAGATGRSRGSLRATCAHRRRGCEANMLRRPLTNDFNSRRLPSKRSLQSLLTPEQMNIAIQRESARSDRNGGEFALVLFRIRNRDHASLSTVRLAKTLLGR